MGVSSTRIGPSNRLTGKSGGWTPALLSPTVWFDAASLTSGSTTWSNLGTGGSALDGTFGAGAAAPRVLPHTGTNYLYLPGVAGNYATTPNSASLQVTGAIEVVARLALVNWHKAAEQAIYAKWLSTGNLKGLSLKTSATGSIMYYSDDGITTRSVGVPSLFSLSDNSWGWVRFQFQPNNAGVSTLTVHQAADSATEPTSWTLVGSANGTAVASTFATTANVAIGAGQSDASGTLDNPTGRIGRVIVRNGIGGTTVFDADFTTGITSGGQTGIFDSSSDNAAVTINRSASGYKATAVVRPTLLFGGGQNIDVADNALLNFDASTSMTVVAVTRQWGTPVSFGRLVDKKNGGGIGVGWSLSNVGTTIQPGLYLGDATNQSSATAATGSTGLLAVYTGVVDRTSNLETSYLNPTAGSGVSTSTIATLVNSLPMRIGAAANALGSYHEGEINAVLLFRRGLTAAEITQIVNYYDYEGALAYTVGTLTTSAGYNILTFTGSGTFTAGRNLPVEYLVVAGGGGGGGTTGAGTGAGGGGAGGLLTNVGSTKFVMSKAQQTVTIGAGGAGTTSNGTAGTASSIGALLVADGGGRGGTWTSTGTSGGSGGGSGAVASGNALTAAGSATAGQGFAGGQGNAGTGSARHGGGGGGAGSIGGAGTPTVGGAGGSSVNNAISGTVTAYAGGGGGGGTTAGGAAGGGGSTAGTTGVSAVAATANTGGGGGGTGSNTATAYTGGAGGSGIVIIRWPA